MGRVELQYAVTTEADPTAELVELPEGFRIPQRFTAWAEGTELPYDVELLLAYESGRVVADAVTARRKQDGRPVSGEALRQIPVAAITQMATSAQVLEINRDFESQLTRAVRARPRRPDDEALGYVAAVYRFALLNGWPPTARVATTFLLPRATAARWVRMARDRGFLGAAEPRKAGEIRQAKRRRKPRGAYPKT